MFKILESYDHLQLEKHGEYMGCHFGLRNTKTLVLRSLNAAFWQRISAINQICVWDPPAGATQPSPRESTTRSTCPHSMLWATLASSAHAVPRDLLLQPVLSQHLAQGLIQFLFTPGHSVLVCTWGMKQAVATGLNKMDDLRPAPQWTYFICTGSLRRSKSSLATHFLLHTNSRNNNDYKM